MTLPCSRNLTQQPAFGGDDIAFCAFGLWTKTRHLRWVTLSEQKWVILAEYRGQTALFSTRQSLVNAQVQQMNAAVLLVEALGGGWDNADLPTVEQVSGKPPESDRKIQQ